MITSLPTRMNGRPVLVSTIYDEGDFTKPASIWEVMQHDFEYGIWYRLKMTIGMDKKTLDKLCKAVRMRIYTRGLDDYIKVKVAESDGFCFQWIASPDKEASERKRRERLDKKLRLNRLRQ